MNDYEQLDEAIKHAAHVIDAIDGVDPDIEDLLYSALAVLGAAGKLAAARA